MQKHNVNNKDNIFTGFAYESKQLQLENKNGISNMKNIGMFNQGNIEENKYISSDSQNFQKN